MTTHKRFLKGRELMETMKAALVREFANPLTIKDVFDRLQNGRVDGRVVLSLSGTALAPPTTAAPGMKAVFTHRSISNGLKSIWM